MAKRLLLGLALTTVAAWPAAAQDFPLRILHVNDVHARYDQTTATGTFCTAKDEAANKCVGGAARLATKLKELRTGNALFLDAGDQFQGTLFYNQYKDAVAYTILDLLKPDAQTIGNHEFDDGPQGLASYLNRVTWPVISANIVTGKQPALRGRIKPSTVVTRGGQKIGIVGLTTVETPTSSSPGPTVGFADEARSLQAAVDALRRQGVDKIIALTHVGYSNDQQLAATVEGVDVFVGGHSHTLLSNSDQKAAGPYPYVAKSPSGAPVLVVQAGAYSTHLGQLDVVFDDKGVVKSWTGDAKLIGADVPQDPVVAEKVRQLNVPLETLRRTPVGEAKVDLVGSSSACRFRECVLGDLIADALLAHATAKGGYKGTAVALQNGGGIRSSIPAGAVTMGQLLEVLPFSNSVATAELTGADLLKDLEAGVARAHDPNAPGTGRFPQVAGLRYSFAPAKPEGQRIQKVEVRDKAGAWAPLDPAATYTVFTNDFVRKGGDGYVNLAKAKVFYDYGPELEGVVADYIKRNSPVAPALDGRITRVE